MKRLSFAVAAFVLCAAGDVGAAQGQQPATPTGNLTLPIGTKIELAVIAPVRARTAKVGDPLYMQADFPVALENRVAIPAGVYVQGVIQSIAPPTRRKHSAEIQVLFTKIIFANGYAIALPQAPAAGSNPSAAATAAKLTIEASPSNDLLLDNGAQIEMTLAAPLSLDAQAVDNAIPLSHAPQPGKFKSATLCRPTPGYPGSPGTPDTVIPGTPGTPSTTIPGGPGMPDITIPGTPGTPATVIPGTPATPDTPGTACPAPPIVLASEPLTFQPAPQTKP